MPNVEDIGQADRGTVPEDAEKAIEGELRKILRFLKRRMGPPPWHYTVRSREYRKEGEESSRPYRGKGHRRPRKRESRKLPG